MATRHRVFSHLAAGLLVPLLLASIAAGQSTWQVCGDSGNYTANSIYLSNLAQLYANIPKRASSNWTLFATGSAGSVPEIAYALALCRGDINASACETCVAAGFLDAQQFCAFNKDATVIYDLCYLRFSNQNFLASTTGSDNNSLIRKNWQKVSSPVGAFDAAVGILLNATSDYAARNSSRRFATGEKGFDTTNLTIYGLVQCTPDMSPVNCRSCLADLSAYVPRDLSGRLGGRILGVRCNFWYEVYPFFSGGPMLRLPAPPAQSPPTATPGAALTCHALIDEAVGGIQAYQ